MFFFFSMWYSPEAKPPFITAYKAHLNCTFPFLLDASLYNVCLVFPLFNLYKSLRHMGCFFFKFYFSFSQNLWQKRFVVLAFWLNWFFLIDPERYISFGSVCLNCLCGLCQCGGWDSTCRTVHGFSSDLISLSGTECKCRSKQSGMSAPACFLLCCTFVSLMEIIFCLNMLVCWAAWEQEGTL